MRSRASLIVGAVALAICLICPLSDMFDQWDHALQTGHDSEYPLVVMALCVGAAYELVRLIAIPSPGVSRSSVRHAVPSILNSVGWMQATDAVPASPSPPPNLRI